MSSYFWIDQASALAQQAPALKTAQAVALDTEFVRTDTFYPQLGLIQVAVPNEVLLIDALVPACLTGFEEALLAARQPLWVLHSCAEDLEVVYNQWGRLPQKVADTQLAAAFLGRSRQMSLQSLLANDLGVHLTKDETRSNWCHRPLNNGQLNYAAEDVRYLLPLWERLSEALVNANRMSWFEEDCAKLLTKAVRQTPFDQMYLQFHDAWQLKEKSLSVLQALVIWREETARIHNKPRGFIVKDPVLYAIAERLPKTPAALASIPNIMPASIRRFADEILQRVNETPVVPGLAKPQRPLSNAQRDLLKRIKSWLEVQAEHLHMPVELLAGRKQLEHLIRLVSGQETQPLDEWTGWRQEVLEPGIMDIVQNEQD